ncbi:MAG: hypothetical protein AB1597_03940 [Chloroflexota bacterium]
MLPDWFAKAVMSGSFAAIRIVCYIAENGKESVGPDGRRVIIACVTYRELQRACGFSNRRTITNAISDAVAAGWLSLRRSYARGSSVYIVPLALSGSVSEPGVTSSHNFLASTGSPDEPIHDSGGRGGNDDVIHPEYRDIDNHHHHELVQKLNRYGFSDAASFVERHSPERIEAAIRFIKTLKGVRNWGALIRRTVERPGEIPRPPAPEELYYDGPFGHLVAR